MTPRGFSSPEPEDQLPLPPEHLVPGRVPPAIKPLPKRRNTTLVLSVLVVLLIVAVVVVGTRLAANQSVSQVQPSVVNIVGQLQDGTTVRGSGMVIAANGVVLTNNHVIDSVSDITVEVPATHKTYDATVIGGDATHDIAVIKMSGAKGLPVIASATATPKSGDHVTALGNALGFGGSPTVSECQVNSLGQTITATDESGTNSETLYGMIQISGVIEPGDSGGPLINTSGQVVGVDTASDFGFQPFSGQVGFAIPIGYAMSIAHQLMAGQNPG